YRSVWTRRAIAYRRTDPKRSPTRKTLLSRSRRPAISATAETETTPRISSGRPRIANRRRTLESASGTGATNLLLQPARTRAWIWRPATARQIPMRQEASSGDATRRRHRGSALKYGQWPGPGAQYRYP